MALRPTFISLFAGCGGLDLAVRLAVPDARCVCYVEEGKLRRVAILEARFKGQEALDDAPVWSDVSAFDGKPWRGLVDGIAGGFPCQDLSYAGKGAGIRRGNRSGLYYEYVRIIREVEPRWVYIENVPAALAFPAGGIVLGELAALGFDAEWGTLRASDVGASHKRKRIFVLANRNDRRRESRSGHGRLCLEDRRQSRTNAQPCMYCANLDDAICERPCAWRKGDYRGNDGFLADADGCNVVDAEPVVLGRRISARGVAADLRLSVPGARGRYGSAGQPALPDSQPPSGSVAERGVEVECIECAGTGNFYRNDEDGDYLKCDECGGSGIVGYSAPRGWHDPRFTNGNTRPQVASGGSGLDVDDTPMPRFRTRLCSAGGEICDETWRTQPCGRCDGVGHPDDEGLEGRRHLAGECGGERAAGAAGDGMGFVFAPGPADAVWGDVLVQDFGLRPALSPAEAESCLRRVADGLASPLDQRIDRLRAGGNGVVAVQGAAAFRELMRRAGGSL